jgi:hypothetical protein
MGNVSDQSIIFWQYLLNASWVLLPLIPAIVIYLMFPDTRTTIGGPFSGLSVKSSGAFAAYFIVLLATFPLLNMQNRNFNTVLRPSWVITGTIQVQDEEGREIDYDRQVGSPLRVTLNPDPLILEDRKTFRVTVPEIDGRIPAIEVGYFGFGTKGINVARPAEGLNVEVDEGKHQIEITSPLVIRRRPCVGTDCEPTSPQQ